MFRKLVPLACVALAGCIQPLYESSSSGGSGATSNGTGGTSGSTQIAATRSAPEVMFVVDKSGSMNDVATDGGSQSRWQDLVNVMTGQSGVDGYVTKLEDELSSQAGEAPLFGLTSFPSDASCGAGVVQIAPAANNEESINAVIHQLQPSGGTPTAATFGILAQAFSSSSGRDRFIILLTDGIPDCNDDWSGNPDDCQESDAQRCASSGCCFSGSTPSNSCSPEGCLDDAHTISAIQSVSAETFVIGFGADLANPSTVASQTLLAMAQAGGSGELYSATDSASLASSLQTIADSLLNRCTFALASAAPATFGSVVLAAGANTRTVDASHVSLSEDRLHATVADVACAAVPGHEVTLTFH